MRKDKKKKSDQRVTPVGNEKHTGSPKEKPPTLLPVEGKGVCGRDAAGRELEMGWAPAVG